MNDDILPLVISHIRSTAALLRLRATCRAALRELSVERVMGMPLERIRLFARPCSESIGVAKQTARPEDIGASFTDQGESFWTWGNTASGRVCINRYERQKGGEAWKQLGMYEASNPSATFLWLHVAEAGVISMLSAADNSLPIIFTAFRCEQRRPLFHCEIDKRLLLDDDASPPAYRFNKRNLLFASWAGRSFLAILPVSRQASSVGLMRIEADGGEWRWWDVSVTRDDEQTLLPIRAMCQVDSCIYVMPGLGGALFALDLAADAPHPRPVDTLPLLDAEVSMIQVLLILCSGADKTALLSAFQNKTASDVAECSVFNRCFPTKSATTSSRTPPKSARSSTSKRAAPRRGASCRRSSAPSSSSTPRRRSPFFSTRARSSSSTSPPATSPGAAASTTSRRASRCMRTRCGRWGWICWCTG